MKVGSKIIIKKSISLRNIRGKIISSIPGDDVKKYLLKIEYQNPLFLIATEPEFSRAKNCSGAVSLHRDQLFIEVGSHGVIIESLPHSRCLCEFNGPFCNIELSVAEITLWDPKKQQFALLNTVRLIEDVPEHNLKRGLKGVIILVFFQPKLAYEVEFCLNPEAKIPSFTTHTFLPEQLEFVSGSAL